ncbi:hypothetical protein [Variovorax sp. PBL-E5]|uniref:hypothetical protein n=1 Tax=Variovorax sp. PBL-E5 TaxID=434014 RepID=UPI001316F305|nr:hypothetical protein [Variovorax sp. PBL-E5]VTU46178.1 hypothetical protein E5P2_00540 [Variovorax sp. PBL-E5]
MQIADGFLLAAKGTEIGATPAPAAHPLLIKPWIPVPAAKARRPVRRCMDARVIPYMTFKAAYMAPGNGAHRAGCRRFWRVFQSAAS